MMCIQRIFGITFACRIFNNILTIKYLYAYYKLFVVYSALLGFLKIVFIICFRYSSPINVLSNWGWGQANVNLQKNIDLIYNDPSRSIMRNFDHRHSFILVALVLGIFIALSGSPAQAQ